MELAGFVLLSYLPVRKLPDIMIITNDELLIFGCGLHAGRILGLKDLRRLNNAFQDYRDGKFGTEDFQVAVCRKGTVKDGHINKK